MIAGSGRFTDASQPLPVTTESLGPLDTVVPEEADDRSLIVFDSGDEITVRSGEEGIRFLLVSGKPIQEPVAWHGPVVMNTQEGLQKAFDELQAGTFLTKAPLARLAPQTDVHVPPPRGSLGPGGSCVRAERQVRSLTRGYRSCTLRTTQPRQGRST